MDKFLLTLKTDTGIPVPHWGSLTHGILIETLPEPWPELLHEGEIRMYSQWVECGNTNVFVWHINCLEDELGEQIEKSFSEKKSLFCKYMNCEWTVLEYRHEHTTVAEYMKRIFLSEKPASGIAITYRTPATHKSNGRYAIFPSVESIGQNIRARFCALQPDFALADDEAAEQIYQHVRISKYRLQSANFFLEGHYVNGYTGYIELHFDGPDPLRRLAETLFAFAEWTGIGVKTSLGMGACNVKRLEGRKV